jgi:hypothetical protein
LVAATPVKNGRSWTRPSERSFNELPRADGLHIVLVLLGAWITTRVIRWAAEKISRRLDVTVDIVNTFGLPVGSLVAPAAVLGAARAVIDIPVPASVDMNRVNEILRGVSASAMNDEVLPGCCSTSRR